MGRSIRIYSQWLMPPAVATQPMNCGFRVACGRARSGLDRDRRDAKPPMDIGDPDGQEAKLSIPKFTRHSSPRRIGKGQLNVWLVFALALGTAACDSVDSHLSKPVIVHTTLLANASRTVMQPTAVARASDGGFVVAGLSDGGWAVKTDPVGHVIWRYERVADESVRYFRPSPQAPFTPHMEFRGVAPMPDGSTYLCGSLVHSQRQIGPVIITHIDKNGGFVSEAQLHPADDDRPNIYSILNCIAWRDGVVAVASSIGKDESRFWVFALDRQGKLRWEKRFEPLPNPTSVAVPASQGETEASIQNEAFFPEGLRVSMAPTPDGKSMIFTSDGGRYSELVAMSDDGQILATKLFPWAAFMLPPVQSGNRIFLYQGSDSTDQDNGEVTTLSGEFNTVSTMASAHSALKLTYSGHALPDGTFLLFGMLRGFGRLVPAGVAHVDRTLRHEQHLAIAVPGSALGSADPVGAPGATPGDFMVAVPVVLGPVHNPGPAPTPGAALMLLHIR